MLYKLEHFGKEIRKIRKNLSLRQSDVKESISIDEDTLKRLENGLSQPSLNTLNLLSMAYKQDILQVYSDTCESPIRYIERTIKKVEPLIRHLDFQGISDITNEFYQAFTASSEKNIGYIKEKMLQFHEYLLSLQNMMKSFSDISRNDLSNLLGTMALDVNALHNKNKTIHLDRLEIRIFVLLSIIYRYKSEFDNSEIVLKIALRELTSKHIRERDYLYFYVLITTNLMTVYHRKDDFDSINKLYDDFVGVFEEQLGMKNLSLFLIRVGINKYYLHDTNYNSFVNVALELLNRAGYHDVEKRSRTKFRELYQFLDI